MVVVIRQRPRTVTVETDEGERPKRGFPKGQDLASSLLGCRTGFFRTSGGRGAALPVAMRELHRSDRPPASNLVTERCRPDENENENEIEGTFCRIQLSKIPNQIDTKLHTKRFPFSFAIVEHTPGEDDTRPHP
jgi:hypothetical protein